VDKRLLEQIKASPTTGSGWNGKYMSPEARAKLSQASKGNQKALGHRLTDEHKEALSRRHTNKQVSAETRLKLSQAAKISTGKRAQDTEYQRKHSQKLKQAWASGKFANRRRDPQAGKKISDAWRLRRESGAKNHKLKRAIMTPKGRFGSVTEAAQAFNVSKMTIYTRVKRQPTEYYLMEKYYEDQ
jgi:hypothetical protein